MMKRWTAVFLVLFSFSLQISALASDGKESFFSAPIGQQGRLISGDEIVEAARKYLVKQMESESREYTLELLNRPNDRSTPEGDVVYECKLPYGVKYGFPTNVSVSVYVDGQLYKKTMVRIRVHIFESVVVAARLLDAKQMISAGDIRLERTETTKAGHYYFTNVDEVIGKVLKRVVNEGAMLNSLMLDKPLIVERMAMVQIVYRQGNLTVGMDGIALQSGREGDFIRVKNIRSNRAISAKVIDAVTVEVSAR